MGATLSFFVDLLRRNKPQVHDVIDAVEDAAVDALHDVADCADQLVEQL